MNNQNYLVKIMRLMMIVTNKMITIRAIITMIIILVPMMEAIMMMLTMSINMTCDVGVCSSVTQSVCHTARGPLCNLPQVISLKQSLEKRST